MPNTKHIDSSLDLRNRMPSKMIAIALVSAAMLLFQVAITRILSATIWYHYSFMCISLALLGVGAPGVWFCFFKPTRRALSISLIASGISTVATILLIINVLGLLPDSTFVMSGVGSMLQARIIVTFFLISVVMLALGAAICLLLLAAPGKQVGVLYGADLLGATLGALVVVPFLHLVPTPQLIAGCALLPLMAHLVLFPDRKLFPLLLGALLVTTFFFTAPYNLRYNKSYKEPDNALYERWTPTARLVIFPGAIYNEDVDQLWMWGVNPLHKLPKVPQLWLDQDGSAGTPIIKRDKPIESYSFLMKDVTSLGYQMVKPENACIIGAGGGRDILTALVADTKQIDAVEMNPYIVEAVSKDFGKYSGNIYNHPGVSPHVSEGRSFLTRSEKTYDMIQIALIDSWAATAAGSFALSENYLYTKEAISTYLKRLSPNGAVSISRWSKGPHQLEMLRLLVIVRQALLDFGIEHPEKHILVSGAGFVSTVLIFNKPTEPDQLTRLSEIEAEQKFERVWPPKEKTKVHPLISGIFNDTENTIVRLFRSGVDLSASTDDKPFYFQTLTLFGTHKKEDLMGMGYNEHSVLVLRGVVIIVSLLTLLLFFAPFLFRGKFSQTPDFWRGSLYFAMIGVSFMLVEAAWIQRFILYLGHPSYAVTIVLSTMLCGLGAGSIVSVYVPFNKITKYAILLPLVLLAVNASLGHVMSATLGYTAGIRMIISIILILPVALLMGFAFPSGMLRFGDEAKAWNWALNGAAGVMASVVSLALAMLVGFSAVVLLSVIGYLIAAIALRVSSAKKTT